MSQAIELPLFEPMPSCGNTNDNLDYELVGEALSWVTLNKKDRIVELATDDEKLLGRAITITVKASLGNLVQEMSFAMTFLKKAEAAPLPTPDPEPQPQPEEEKKEDKKEEVKEGT